MYLPNSKKEKKLKELLLLFNNNKHQKDIKMLHDYDINEGRDFVKEQRQDLANVLDLDLDSDIETDLDSDIEKENTEIYDNLFNILEHYRELDIRFNNLSTSHFVNLKPRRMSREIISDKMILNFVYDVYETLIGKKEDDEEQLEGAINILERERDLNLILSHIIYRFKKLGIPIFKEKLRKINEEE